MNNPPDHDVVLEALEQALLDNLGLRDFTPKEVARQLVIDGYMRVEPPPSVVGEALATVAVEEQAFGPDVPAEEA